MLDQKLKQMTNTITYKKGTFNFSKFSLPRLLEVYITATIGKFSWNICSSITIFQIARNMEFHNICCKRNTYSRIFVPIGTFHYENVYNTVSKATFVIRDNISDRQSLCKLMNLNYNVGV